METNLCVYSNAYARRGVSFIAFNRHIGCRSSPTLQPWRKRINNRAPPSGAEHFHSNSRFGPRCLMLIPVNVCVLLVFLFFFVFALQKHIRTHTGGRGENAVPSLPPSVVGRVKSSNTRTGGVYGKGSMFYISSGL